MSENYHYVGDYIKQGACILLVLALSVFGIKSCRKHQKKRDIIIELSSRAGESAAYDQFYRESADQNLIQTMHQLYLAETLGITPGEIINEVMQHKQKDFLSTARESELPIRKELISKALLDNYSNCKKLGLFDSPANLDAMSRGEMPTISRGPANDETIVILPTIDPEALPGVEKFLPNMVISPPPGNEPSQRSQLQVAKAKLLAKSLLAADLVERSAYDEIIEYYDRPPADPALEGAPDQP